jgi:hypothetical protein
MKISPVHLEAIRKFGYTDSEAHFLYIVAMHSGYFTQRQFGNLIQNKPGRAVHAFIERASEKHHLKQITLQNNGHVYQLSFKPIYKSIQNENIRNRRGHSLEFIKTRLAILDFVLEHLDNDYLEGEPDKVRYFQEELHIDRTAMPGRTYKGSNQSPDTVRYFVDKFPILFDSPTLPERPVPTFTYIDPGFENVKGFRLHLETYSAFLNRLSGFEFIYACPTTNPFHAVEHAFEALIAPRPHQQLAQVMKYFRLRVAWEAKRYGQLSNADLEFLNDAKSRFAGDAIQSLYAKWIAGGFGEDQLTLALQALLGSERKIQFKTYKLPYSYLLFDQNSSVSGKPFSNRVSLRFSSRFSSHEDSNPSR